MSTEQWQADQLAAAARTAQAAPPAWWGSVQTINDDHTVTVRGLGSDHTSVRCATSYWPRAAGDAVLVQETSAGPVVVGSVAPPVVHVQLEGVTFATSAPAGSQWVTPTAVRVDPSTRQVVYVVPAGTGTAAPPTTGAGADTLQVSADRLASYSGSGSLLHETYAEQGQYSGSIQGNQTGAFWFPAGSFAALSGKTIIDRSVAVRRRAASHGNTWGPVPAWLWTQTAPAGSATVPTLTAGPYLLGEARLGEVAVDQDGLNRVPADVLTTLIAGGGLAIYAPQATHNFEADQCVVTITYQ